MRLVSGVLACIGVGAISMALADPSADAPAAATPSSRPAASAPATPAAPAATATPAPAATTAAAATAPAASPDEQLEKHFLSEGYKVQMRGGQKQYCRKEAQVGSRLGGEVNCSSLQQLKATEDQTQSALQHQQHSYTKPTG
jgi:hypothetical protein